MAFGCFATQLISEFLMNMYSHAPSDTRMENSGDVQERTHTAYIRNASKCYHAMLGGMIIGG
jgi:hypothetical protein